MYQTVLFDLDGTLLDTITDLAEAGNVVCRANDWPEYSIEEFRGMVGHGIENLIARLSPPEAQSEARRRQTLEQFNAYYDCHSADHTRPFPGMEDLTARLKADGIQLAVYSNKPDQFTQDLIRRFYPGVFDWIQGKRADFPVKPDPAGVRAILRALNADPARALFVGDSATDVATGHNADLPVCAVTWGYRPRASLIAAGADFLADTPAQLENVICKEASFA